MPRPFGTPAVPGLTLALCCAALGPATLHAALAAVAGTLFEAAPFVLVAEALPLGGRFGLRPFGQGFGIFVALASCGCGGPLPGALSIASIGLCWLTFGPAVALARTAAGLALVYGNRRRNRTSGHAEPPDALGELLALAPSAALAAILSGAVASHAGASWATPFGRAAAFGLGLVLGCIAPCGTAAVAMAAAFAPHLMAAAAGILVTGGLAPRLLRFGGASPGPGGRCRETPGLEAVRRIDLARLALAVSLATLALRGPRGFVNARLVPFEGVAAGVALLGRRRPPQPPNAMLVPALLFAALAAGSPEPSYVANETHLDDAFAGERVIFTGVAHRDGATSIVQRFAITCCRIDAAPVAIRTSAPLAVADGTWVSASGVLAQSPSGLLLRTSDWRRVARPADPFVYR
jgi:hypothetical protein